jgi:glycosyltransferase involved in cell wall biosynthesis
LFSALLQPEHPGQPSFVDMCIAAMGARGAAEETPFSALLAQRVPDRRPATSRYGASVMLVGHGGQGTGLSRNFRMLKEALEDGGNDVATLSYDLPAEQFAERLHAWRAGREGDAIVVAAVNAHDIPSLFIRDRHGVLNDCYVVGFFLWETSAAPTVQHLGIALVDEIWTPTDYVAEVYAPFGKPIHVVGKGLFFADRWPQRTSSVPENGPIRFLTIFDFHSSIERKNPLASVLAFQRAFRGGENVELILKASNVDPQHPGNASGQWERLCAASAGDRRIRLVTARYSEEQMRDLMRQVSCVVSLHRAEGFGFVLADAMALGIPVIATDYSGNIDFCDAETGFPVAYSLVPVEAQGSYWESKGTVWADADIASAAAQMLEVYRDYPGALRKAALGRQKLLRTYSNDAFAVRLQQRLAAIRGSHRVDPMIASVQ